MSEKVNWNGYEFDVCHHDDDWTEVPVYTFLLGFSQTFKEFVNGMLCMLVRPKTSQVGFPLMKIGRRQWVLGRLTSMFGLSRMRRLGNRSRGL